MLIAKEGGEEKVKFSQNNALVIHGQPLIQKFKFRQGLLDATGVMLAR